MKSKKHRSRSPSWGKKKVGYSKIIKDTNNEHEIQLQSRENSMSEYPSGVIARLNRTNKVNIVKPINVPNECETSKMIKCSVMRSKRKNEKHPFGENVRADSFQRMSNRELQESSFSKTKALFDEWLKNERLGGKRYSSKMVRKDEFEQVSDKSSQTYDSDLDTMTDTSTKTFSSCDKRKFKLDNCRMIDSRKLDRFYYKPDTSSTRPARRSSNIENKFHANVPRKCEAFLHKSSVRSKKSKSHENSICVKRKERWETKNKMDSKFVMTKNYLNALLKRKNSIGNESLTSSDSVHNVKNKRKRKDSCKKVKEKLEKKDSFEIEMEEINEKLRIALSSDVFNSCNFKSNESEICPDIPVLSVFTPIPENAPIQKVGDVLYEATYLEQDGKPVFLYNKAGYPLTDSKGRILQNNLGVKLLPVKNYNEIFNLQVYDAFNDLPSSQFFNPVKNATPEGQVGIRIFDSNFKPRRLFNAFGFPLTDQDGFLLRDNMGAYLVELDSKGIPRCLNNGDPIYMENGKLWINDEKDDLNVQKIKCKKSKSRKQSSTSLGNAQEEKPTDIKETELNSILNEILSEKNKTYEVKMEPPVEAAPSKNINYENNDKKTNDEIQSKISYLNKLRQAREDLNSAFDQLVSRKEDLLNNFDKKSQETQEYWMKMIRGKRLDIKALKQDLF